MDQLEAHIIPDSNAVLLFLGRSFFRPFRVLYGTPANGTIVTPTSDQQGDVWVFWSFPLKFKSLSFYLKYLPVIQLPPAFYYISISMYHTYDILLHTNTQYVVQKNYFPSPQKTLNAHYPTTSNSIPHLLFFTPWKIQWQFKAKKNCILSSKSYHSTWSPASITSQSTSNRVGAVRIEDQGIAWQHCFHEGENRVFLCLQGGG